MATDPRLARSVDPRQIATPTPSQVQPQPQPQPPPPPPLEMQREKSPPPEMYGTPDSKFPAAEPRLDEGGFKLKFCTVCANNQNRSMEAHLRLALASYPVISFGTGSLVRLPGPSITQPNVYPFNSTTYASMYTELSQKDPRLYRANGLLTMLERNRDIKSMPERWQDWPVGLPRLEKYASDRGSKGVEGGVVDVVITCEERCWDAVVDNLLERGSPLNRPVHVINVDIRDNHEEGLIGGKAILDLADSLNAAATEEREKGGHGSDGWEEGTGDARAGFDQRVPEVLAEWQERWPNLAALWTLAWF